jgi:hypothetical protein
MKPSLRIMKLLIKVALPELMLHFIKVGDPI